MSLGLRVTVRAMVRGTLPLSLPLTLTPTPTRCEKNCVGDKWRSTMATATNDGLHGCVDGSETGEVMCVCKQGVQPIVPGSGAPATAAGSSAAAPSTPATKPSAKPSAKKSSRKQQEAAAVAGKAKGKGCECSAAYACCDVVEGACSSPRDKSRPYSFCGGTAKSAPACSVSSATCTS